MKASERKYLPLFNQTYVRLGVKPYNPQEIRPLPELLKSTRIHSNSPAVFQSSEKVTGIFPLIS